MNRASIFEQSIPFGMGLVVGDGEIVGLTILDVFTTASMIHHLQETLEELEESTRKNKLSREMASFHREFDAFKGTKCFQYHSQIYHWVTPRSTRP